MSTLLFLLTVLSLVVLCIMVCVKLFRRKPVAKTLFKMAAIAVAYAIIWLICFMLQQDVYVPLGTDVCFDDWCATVTRFNKVDSIGSPLRPVKAGDQLIVLYVTMSNHARGIAQTPSEPRIHIIDDAGNSWGNAPAAQEAFELTAGKQLPLNARLNLHQSIQTMLAFEIPGSAKNLKAVIEEGPFITRLLLAGDREVFKIE